MKSFKLFAVAMALTFLSNHGLANELDKLKDTAGKKISKAKLTLQKSSTAVVCSEARPDFESPFDTAENYLNFMLMNLQTVRVVESFLDNGKPCLVISAVH